MWIKFTIGKRDDILMTFLSSSIVAMVMFLLPVIKVCIPSFERKMTVKELLNFINFLVKLGSGSSVFSFRIQKFSGFFRSSHDSSVVVKIFVLCSVSVNFASLWKLLFEFWKCLQVRIGFLFLLSFLCLFNLILKGSLTLAKVLQLTNLVL